MRFVILAGVVMMAACGRRDFDPLGPLGPPRGDAVTTTSPDSIVSCDPATPFGMPVPIAELDINGAYDSTFQLEPDELTGYFYSDRSGDYDIYVATRPDFATAWTVAPVSGVNTTNNEAEPAISPDGKTLVFSSDRVDPNYDLFVATFDGTTFSGTNALATLDTTSVDYHPFFQLDSNVMWFASNRGGSLSIYETTYSGTTFAPPVHVTELDVAGFNTEVATVLSGGLVMYFRSNRPGGPGGSDIWTASRTSTANAWGSPQLLTELASSQADTPNWISRDGCRLYMSSGRNDASDIFLATRAP